MVFLKKKHNVFEVFMPKIDFSTSKTCIGMHRSSECDRYTLYSSYSLTTALRKVVTPCEKKNCVFLSSVLFNLVPKDRFSSNFYSTFTGLLRTDVGKCRKIYRRCFLQSVIKNHGWDPKQGKNAARICSPA